MKSDNFLRARIGTGIRSAFLILISIAVNEVYAATENGATFSANCVQGGNAFNVSDTTVDGSVARVLATRSESSFGCTVSGSGSAGNGALSLAVASNTVAGSDAVQYGRPGNFSSSSILSQISVTPEPGSPDGIIDMALAFDLSGSVIGDQLAASALGGNFRASLTYNISVSGAEDVVSPFSESLLIDVNDASCPPTGCFQDLDTSYVTESFKFDTNKQLRIVTSLFGTVGAGAFFGGTAGSAASGTLSFRGNDAFILPDGYVVNISDANIVNNQWLGTTPVPVPASLVLLASGLLSLMRRNLFFWA